MSRILIVDDDIQLLSSLSVTLEDAGYTIFRASRLDQAGRIVATESPDLVLLEVATEQGKGWDFLRDVVDVGAAPVIVATGHGLEEDVVAALDLGATDVLTKPFRTQELLARIRVRLRQSAQHHAHPTHAAIVPVPGVTTRAQPVTADGADFDTPVFMDPVAEHSLLQERLSAEVYDGDIETLPLSQRLRAARQRLKLSLVQVELDTKLRIWYVQAMEEGRFGMLPRGMAEPMLRTYAVYLGLDLEHVLNDFRAEYADLPVQPLPYLGGRPEPHDIPRWIVVTSAIILALVVGLGGIWLFVPDQVVALNANLRAYVNPPTATTTPTITPKPTLTPTRTPLPTATRTPLPTQTSLPPTLPPLPNGAITATPGP